MYYLKLSRSNETIDPATCNPRLLTHGKNVWDRPSGIAFFWDKFEKRFVTYSEFVHLKEKRAEANRRQFSLLSWDMQRVAMYGSIKHPVTCV